MNVTDRLMTDAQIDNATPPLDTAILFLVFNRPSITAQVFEAIRKARPPRLYVAADGPRAGREPAGEPRRQCAQARGRLGQPGGLV